MPSLCSSAPTEKPGVPLLDQEGGELFAIDLGEDGEEVGEAGVGDPHLLAVQDVVLPSGGEDGAGAEVHGVGAGGGFGERIGADPFAGGQLGQDISASARRVPYQTMGSVPMPVWAVKATEKLASWRRWSATMAEVTLSMAEAAIRLGDVDGHQAEVAGLLQQGPGDVEILGLDLLRRGQHLVAGEFSGGLGDLPLLFGEVFRRE